MARFPIIGMTFAIIKMRFMFLAFFPRFGFFRLCLEKEGPGRKEGTKEGKKKGNYLTI